MPKISPQSQAWSSPESVVKMLEFLFLARSIIDFSPLSSNNAWWHYYFHSLQMSSQTLIFTSSILDAKMRKSSSSTIENCPHAKINTTSHT